MLQQARRERSIAMLKLRTAHLLIFATATLNTVAVAHAVSLASGETVNVQGTSLATDPSLQGTIVANSVSTISARNATLPGQLGSQIFIADLRTTVVRESATGTLDFYYQISNPN